MRSTDVLAELAAVAVLLAGCGAGPIASSSAGSLPGQGKPSIVLGDKNSVQEILLGELYAQAFRARGFIVDLKPNIDGSQQIDKAFQSGHLNAYLEYLGDAAEQHHGATVMTPTPFSNADGLIALKSYAQAKHLTTISQLSRLGPIKVGGYPAAQTRNAGYVGLQQAYRLTNLQFVPVAAGAPTYAALDSHEVQVAEAVSTDPQLASGTYAVLSDPKNIFGFQHAALIIETSLLSRLGPAFQQTYTSLTSLLTIDAMRTLTGAVVIHGEIPASVAHTFLVANHLLSS